MRSPVAFDPSATCPRWDKFLREVFDHDEDLVAYIQLAVGYCLTGDTSEQCLFLAHGDGSNGKSTFLNAIGYILGDYSHNLPFSSFEIKSRSNIPNDVASLVGKRFVTSVETGEAQRLNESRVKALTGGDPITARFLHAWDSQLGDSGVSGLADQRTSHPRSRNKSDERIPGRKQRSRRVFRRLLPLGAGGVGIEFRPIWGLL
jgi:hypothetical protein